MSFRVLAVAAALAAAPALAATPDQIVVFGDSLVDAGNIFLATGGFAPTNVYNNPSQGYFPGRFTNGPDYTDLLSQRLLGHLSVPSLAGGSNYAFGGATIVANADAVPDLGAQLGLYFAGHLHADPRALYIINAGGNDVFGLEAAGYTTGAPFSYASALTTTLIGSIKALSAAGATNILITGIPNTDAVGVQLDQLVNARVLALAATLPTTTLHQFDYIDFFTQLSADPAAFGVAPFTHAPGDGCFNHLTPPATADCSGFFSVDGVHPIAPIQAAIYREVAATLGISAVPEPAAWGLMVAGFGLVGTAVRRRASAPARTAVAA